MTDFNKVAELREQGHCILRGHFGGSLINACKDAFEPVLRKYITEHRHEANRGTNRHFLPMPFDPPCFAPEFFFDKEVLGIVHEMMGDRVVADQWGCDVPLQGSEYQNAHVDYQRPLFSEIPDLQLPAYMLVVSFGRVPVNRENGPIEIAPGTHRMPRKEAIEAVENGSIKMHTINLEIGDVLIRHPWALHRGTPNITDIPRALVTIRYVRHWYAYNSREVNPIPLAVLESLTVEQRNMMRFPVASN